MAKQHQRYADSRDTTRPPNPIPMEGGPGASDADSGGGAGAGIPDAETAMRTGGRPYSDADVKRDREKLFPETVHRPPPGPRRETGRSERSAQAPSRKNPRAVAPRSQRRRNVK